MYYNLIKFIESSIWFRPNVLAFIPMGFAAGLPLLLTASTLGVWMADIGVNRTTIGMFALVGTPYALKFLWAPLVDKVSLGFFTKKLGQRRGWVLISQIFSACLICLMAFINPSYSPISMAVVALLLAFCSATQDIAIDAWRIELHKVEELGIGAAMYVYGYRIALLVAGAGALIIADFVSWKVAYLTMASLLSIGMLTVFLRPEAKTSKNTEKNNSKKNVFIEAVIKPITEFASRPGWISILGFVALFKLGDALAGVMVQPFLIEIGFTKTEIASIAKIYGFFATILGLAVGGFFIASFGMLSSLWLAGILQLLSNFVFCLQAIYQNNLNVLILTISAENLAGGIGTAVFIAYLSLLCNIRYTAFQYALLSSFMAFARTWLSSPSGWLVDNINWEHAFSLFRINSAGLLPLQMSWIGFFVLTAVAAIPGLLLLLKVREKGMRRK